MQISIKMLKRYCLILFLLSLLFSACSTDFEVNEKWKEIHIIYGLLSHNDTQQVIKINKAFLNENTSVHEVSKIQDSLFLDSLDVTLTNLRTGAVSNLRKIYLENKEAGVFSSPGQFLYFTPDSFQLDFSANYALKVVNPKTGVESSAQAPVVDTITPGHPSRHSKFSFQHGVPAPQINFTSGKDAKVYELNLYIKIKETNITTGTSQINSLKWPLIESYVLPNTLGGHTVIYSMKGDRFFDFLKSKLEINPNIERELDKIGFEVLGGGEELFNYMEVNKPSIGVVQKNSDYTNVDNGFGIFSSRSRTYFESGISDATAEELKESLDMKPYNFQ